MFLITLVNMSSIHMSLPMVVIEDIPKIFAFLPFLLEHSKTVLPRKLWLGGTNMMGPHPTWLALANQS